MITIEYARTLYDDSDPVHDFDHVLRVLTLARRIGPAEGANMAIVETAVLLHDIHRVEDNRSKNGNGHEPTDHALLAADHARQILAQITPAAGPDFIDAVAHAIAAHRFRNDVEPDTIEAQVVFDADKLDAIGAIGIARAYAYGGMTGQRLWGDVPPDYAGSGPDHTPYHEFVYKLARIHQRLYTDMGRAIARERHAYMVEFFHRLEREIRGEL
jgi:uncharacterized protein